MTDKIAIIAPRLAGNGAVGGAETLLRNLGTHAVACGLQVDLLTTCAESHFTWENTRPQGTQEVDGMTVHFFPVDDRDVGAFLEVQQRIDQELFITPQEEDTWLRNGVTSVALMKHLQEHIGEYRALVAGPYLFGLTYFAAMAYPEKMLLVPCLHDEPFARVPAIKRMFGKVAGCLFNASAERELARELFGHPDDHSAIVGMGLDAFDADPKVFADRHKITAPYVLYCGRREPLKGTTLLCDYMDAFRELTKRDIRLVFTGSGQIDAPSTLQPAIVDVGFVSEQEKHEAMAGALAFIHPSVNESFGIVLLEAFLAGTPALVHGKSRVLVSQCRAAQAGLWFRNYPDFELQLLTLLDNPELCATLGRNGREFVRREYSWPVIEKKFMDALDRFLPSASSPTA
ncbi:MAG: glycosyltransferase family 4 protein [Kiritimatiellae bacterium]|nr:glycosyltransferase family 4 protein [Kiritimatiellia bacterium]